MENRMKTYLGEMYSKTPYVGWMLTDQNLDIAVRLNI